MIYYSLSLFLNTGIRDILIISTSQDTLWIKELLKDGRVILSNAVQSSSNGLAQSFIIDADFIGTDTDAMVLR